ncbi:amino acid transporter [Serratia sp. MYb239]|uniref:LysE family translocator n=1 Tax=Serratia sp. MYb239 TaxID=2033438 RepID=UPI000CF711EB|nr:LysE family transporter [Serratia sp. MYb239]AVJ17156.1 amino acid transporter [Serratia sp. MYb239]SQJ22304.1 Threonine efflux protein [Serratia rubidaea]
MTELIAVVTLTLLAVISPGPDFAMVSRNSLTGSRASGLYCALGIGLGVLVHVGYTLVGVGLLIQRSLWLFTVLKFIGAAYLIYLGLQMYRHAATAPTPAATPAHNIGEWRALKTGFLTNVLNPKTTIFIVSLFMQVVNPQSSLTVQIGYGLFISVTHILWFGAVALFFSSPAISTRFLRLRSGIDRLFGGLLITFGALLALSNLSR